MKKLVAIVLALVMVLTFVACGENGETAQEKVKIGFIFLHDENSTYDLNFMKSAKEVCETLGVEYVAKVGIGEDDTCLTAAEELYDAGCRLIFADSFGHQPYMIEAAKEFPDAQFVSATGDRAWTEGIENFHNAFADIYQGRFLAGIAAGLKLNEMIENGTISADAAKIGYVGAKPYAEVYSGFTAFFLGARYICPSATMEVTFTGSWYDETAEKEAAQALIANGCVLISQHADSMGAPTACEDANVPNVSYNGSTLDACPNTFIVSSRINWTPYMTYMINAHLNGVAFDTDWCGTIADGSVLLTDVNTKAAAAGTQEKIDEVKALLVSGELQVFDTSTFTVGGAEVTSYLADCAFDEAYTPDTEVVSNGYLHESEVRSAPYFYMVLDGITLK